MKKALSALLFLSLATLNMGRAEATTESTAAASFLLFEPSARASAMGNAYIAIADDANATYYNPAALADFNKQSISTTFYKPVPNLASDIFSSFAAYTHPFDGIGNLGFSLIYTSLGKQFHTDSQGNSLGEFTSFGMGLGVSYGTHLFKDLSVGVTVKFVHENLSSVQVGNEQGKGAGTSFAGDFGLMWKAADRLTFAAALRNVGPNMTFIDADQADPLPQNFTLGVAFVPYKNEKSTFLVLRMFTNPCQTVMVAFSPLSPAGQMIHPKQNSKTSITKLVQSGNICSQKNLPLHYEQVIGTMKMANAKSPQQVWVSNTTGRPLTSLIL